MKLNELAVVNPTKQAAKVFENYFGNSIKFDQITPVKARGMLKRVRALIAEHRRTAEFHRSEQDPNYLKLVVMEQALAATATSTAPQQTPQQQQAAMTLQRQQRQRQLDDEEKQLNKQSQDITARKSAIQKEKAMLEGRRSLKQRLREASEVQQAQVVLASQDMVDQVQKMSEQVSAMQFNTDATAALAGLLQNLQGAKTQLEQALGVVTGQAPVVPGADMGADAGLGGEMPAELPAPGEEEIDVTDVDIEEPAVAGLGRERR